MNASLNQSVAEAWFIGKENTNLWLSIAKLNGMEIRNGMGVRTTNRFFLLDPTLQPNVFFSYCQRDGKYNVERLSDTSRQARFPVLYV